MEKQNDCDRERTYCILINFANKIREHAHATGKKSKFITCKTLVKNSEEDVRAKSDWGFM